MYILIEKLWILKIVIDLFVLFVLQDYYDWGFRVIKFVLVVVGVLKRGDFDCFEDQVLMRVLRDFNIFKIVIDDLLIFMGLIFDFFLVFNVLCKRDMDFEKQIK